jgi:hypothetical protein
VIELTLLAFLWWAFGWKVALAAVLIFLVWALNQ